MDKEKQEPAVDKNDNTDKSEHIEVQTCQCCQCQTKRRYRQWIVDEDAFIANLNDWD